MFYTGYMKCLNDTWNFFQSSAMTKGLESAIIRYKNYLIEVHRKVEEMETQSLKNQKNNLDQ